MMLPIRCTGRENGASLSNERSVLRRRTESGRSRAARSSPLTFRRVGHAINTDQVFGTHTRSLPRNRRRSGARLKAMLS